MSRTAAALPTDTVADDKLLNIAERIEKLAVEAQTLHDLDIIQKTLAQVSERLDGALVKSVVAPMDMEAERLLKLVDRLDHLAVEVQAYEGSGSKTPQEIPVPWTELKSSLGEISAKTSSDPVAEQQLLGLVERMDRLAVEAALQKSSSQTSIAVVDGEIPDAAKVVSLLNSVEGRLDKFEQMLIDMTNAPVRSVTADRDWDHVDESKDDIPADTTPTKPPPPSPPTSPPLKRDSTPSLVSSKHPSIQPSTPTPTSYQRRSAWPWNRGYRRLMNSFMGCHRVLLGDRGRRQRIRDRCRRVSVESGGGWFSGVSGVFAGMTTGTRTPQPPSS
ncbi:hypothetical protein BC829DRAFT_391191 [Chytridium lagenaria]|nr:hypothetical protein BC829DRAFT_391191 [Chytridium lagenaria]